MAKTKFTLYIEADLIERIKIQAIREKRSVSEITEELYSGYLEKHERQSKH